MNVTTPSKKGDFCSNILNSTHNVFAFSEISYFYRWYTIKIHLKDFTLENTVVVSFCGKTRWVIVCLDPHSLRYLRFCSMQEKYIARIHVVVILNFLKRLHYGSVVFYTSCVVDCFEYLHNYMHAGWAYFCRFLCNIFLCILLSRSLLSHLMWTNACYYISTFFSSVSSHINVLQSCSLQSHPMYQLFVVSFFLMPFRISLLPSHSLRCHLSNFASISSAVSSHITFFHVLLCALLKCSQRCAVAFNLFCVYMSSLCVSSHQ